MRPEGNATVRIDIAGEITPALADTVERALLAYPDHSVLIRCDSGGGCWHSSRRIFECLSNHAKRVTAEIVNRAFSGAALIVMSADRRKMYACGSIFLHWPVGDTATRAYLDQVAASEAALIASRCRVPAATLVGWMRDNTMIDAARALAIGLVHEVPGTKPPSHVTVFANG